MRRSRLAASSHCAQGRAARALGTFSAATLLPVDLAQAAIGPGMAVYTRYAKVLDAEGKRLSVREALALINQTLDEALAEQEGDFDADSRWALAWFEQSGLRRRRIRRGRKLSKAKNTSVAGLVEAGILESKPRQGAPSEARRTARRLGPGHRPASHRVGDGPPSDPRARSGGESAAAALVAKLGAKAEIARELAYRLYTLCERKKRAAEALAYNGLVQSWPEITRLARESGGPQPERGRLFVKRGIAMAITNHERVGKALDLLSAGLAPFVEREFKSQLPGQGAQPRRRRFCGDDRLSTASKPIAAVGRRRAAQADVGRRGTTSSARRSATPSAPSCSELRDRRNNWAHQDAFSSDDADRALDSVARLLTAVSAPEADEVDKMKMELRRLIFDEQVAQREAQGRRHGYRERRRPAPSSPGARS